MNYDEKDTKKRVLMAAAEVFGKNGYRAATVRQICSAAGTSVAAVNYYYSSKEQLYLAVLENIMSVAFEKFPPDMGLGENPRPEEKLYAFIKATMLRIIGDDGLFKGKVHGRLIALEISNPSPLLEGIVDKYIKPQRMLLAEIIQELIGEKADQEAVKLCTLSIIGQCFHYAFANPIIEVLKIADTGDKSFMERAIDHIYDFSIGGITRIREGAKQS